MSLGSGLFTKPTAGKPHIVKNRLDGVGGEVGKLRADLAKELAPLAAIAVEEWSAPPAAATNLIKTSIATVASAVTYKGTDLNGSVGAAKFAPRPISCALGAGAHYAGSATIQGYDAQGVYITDTIALAGNGGTTQHTAKYFAQVLAIVLPAQLDTSGTLAFGLYGNNIGLSRTPKARTTALFLLHEFEDGAVAGTAGALIAAGSAAPYGAYTPHDAPNGTHNYAIYYEFDATV